MAYGFIVQAPPTANSLLLSRRPALKHPYGVLAVVSSQPDELIEDSCLVELAGRSVAFCHGLDEFCSGSSTDACHLVGSGVVALRTGEAEEDRVEPVVSERYIEAHEEAAETFVWVSGGTLGIMLLALPFARRRAGLPLAAIATAATLLVLGLGYRTGEAGGALVYQHGAAQAYVGNASTPHGTPPGNIEATDDEDDD